MCDPVTATMALQVASGVAGFAAQNAAAKAQNQAYLANAENAKNAMLADSRRLNLREDQEAQAAAEAKFRNEVEAAKIAASQKVSSGEAGVGGGRNLTYLLNGIEGAKLRERMSIVRNFDMTKEQLGAERDSLQFAFMDRVNGVSKGTAPDPLMAGLGIATNVAGTWGTATGYGTKGTYQFGKGVTPK